MKKIFTSIVLFLTICFAWVFMTSSASAVNVINHKSIFWEDAKQPYCPNPSDCWLEKGIEEAKWQVSSLETEGTAVSFLQDRIDYVLWFLLAISVIIIIFAWVMILTSAWNDDRIQTAKKIIMYCVIWIMVIFVAYPITKFIIDILDKSK